MSSQIKVVVGLGNPGEQFHGTRHNVGFAVLNAFIDKLNASGESITKTFSKKHNSEIGILHSPKAVFVYPQSYMNLSGQPVKSLIDWYKLHDLSKILVVHDDVALPLGKIRWVQNAGAGGQHGVESIIEHLGGRKDFVRLRFGVGPDPGGEKRSAYVLEKFAASEKDVLNESIEMAVESLQLFLKGYPITELMSKFNGLDKNAK